MLTELQKFIYSFRFFWQCCFDSSLWHLLQGIRWLEATLSACILVQKYSWCHLEMSSPHHLLQLDIIPSSILYFALHQGGPDEVRTKLLYSGLIRLKMCPQYSSGIVSCLLPKFIHAEKEGMVYFLGCCSCSRVISYSYARN